MKSNSENIFLHHVVDKGCQMDKVEQVQDSAPFLFTCLCGPLALEMISSVGRKRSVWWKSTKAFIARKFSYLRNDQSTNGFKQAKIIEGRQKS